MKTINEMWEDYREHVLAGSKYDGQVAKMIFSAGAIYMMQMMDANPPTKREVLEAAQKHIQDCQLFLTSRN